MDSEDNEEEIEFLAEVGSSVTKEEIQELTDRVPQLEATVAMVSSRGKTESGFAKNPQLLFLGKILGTFF